jgi:hypothetical protein
MSTINYRYPIAGTVAPTAAQVADLSMVTAQVIMGDADTTAAVVHNMAVAGFGLGYGFPLVISRVALYTGTTAVTIPPTITLTDSNTVTVAKTAETGSGFTMEVQVLRPNSIIT